MSACSHDYCGCILMVMAMTTWHMQTGSVCMNTDKVWKDDQKHSTWRQEFGELCRSLSVKYLEGGINSLMEHLSSEKARVTDSEEHHCLTDGRRHRSSEGVGQELTETGKGPSSQRGGQQEIGPITDCVCREGAVQKLGGQEGTLWDLPKSGDSGGDHCLAVSGVKGQEGVGTDSGQWHRVCLREKREGHSSLGMCGRKRLGARLETWTRYGLRGQKGIKREKLKTEQGGCTGKRS